MPPFFFVRYSLREFKPSGDGLGILGENLY